MIRRSIVVLVGGAWIVACSSASDPNVGGSSGGADSDAGVQTDDASDPTTNGDADGGATPDATTPDDAPAGCGEFAGATHWVCSADGLSRGNCAGGVPSSELCPRGCLRTLPDAGAAADAVCLGTQDTFTCGGSYGTTRSTSGDYYITAFGCWLDASGVEHTNPGDNCIPSCLAKAQAAGLCTPGGTGKECEESVNWYTADGARFGCLARLRVTNPTNGNSVIAVALDYGPSCTVEKSVTKEVLDASGRVDRYLFGADQGAVDRALVHVVEVNPSTPLGPVP